MVLCCRSVVLLIVSGFLLCGCSTSSPPPKPKNTTAVSNATETTPRTIEKTPSAPADNSSGLARSGYWEEYPDIPKYEIMSDVGGIKIPRMSVSPESVTLSGAVPADVGNEHAKAHPSEPANGDTVTIRFQAEPKVLNPITENSAVMRYIMRYVNQDLARRNPETFEYEPRIAKSWVVEDSIKLSPDYAGHERRIAVKGGTGSPSLEFEFKAAPSVDGKPPETEKATFVTTNAKGEPLPHAWIGIYPNERILGATATGFHAWSNDQGEVELSGIPAGKYTIKTGDELMGQSEKQGDGSLVVTPKSTDNPLKETLTLKAGDWIDVHHQTYRTYQLRDDVKWSDGVRFTSRDIEFTYALLNSKYVDGDSIRTYYSDLVECTAVRPLVLRLRYRQPYFQATDYSHEIGTYMAPMHFFENIFKADGRQLTLNRLTPEEEAAKKQISVHGQEFGKFFNTDERYNRKPLGVGPYVVDKWERGDRVELVRNPNYWEPSRAGHLDRVIVKFIIDQVTAFAALKAGEIDFFYDMSPEQYFEQWPTLDQATQETYVRASWFTPRYAYIAWNELSPLFQDRRVRLALSMLFDRQDFIDKKWHGAAVPVSGIQFFYGLGYDQEVRPVAYDPEAARELLTDAGWIDSDNDGILDRNGEKFQVTFRMPKGKPINEQLCEILQKNCKNVGIDLQIQTMEWASFIEKMRTKECDAFMLQWVMELESDPYQIWHSSEAVRGKRGSNTISFRNPQADELIELIRISLDDKKRQKAHYSLHRLLDSEQPYSFLWIPKEFGAYHKRFRNVKWYRLRPGYDLTQWYVPKEEQLHK